MVPMARILVVGVVFITAPCAFAELKPTRQLISANAAAETNFMLSPLCVSLRRPGEPVGRASPDHCWSHPVGQCPLRVESGQPTISQKSPIFGLNPREQNSCRPCEKSETLEDSRAGFGAVELFMAHISGFDRSQVLLLPEAVEDYVRIHLIVRNSQFERHRDIIIKNFATPVRPGTSILRIYLRG